MKMSMHGFAALISWLSMRFERCLSDQDCLDIAAQIEQHAEPARANADEINNLLSAMGVEGKKIEAIRAYRALTGYGLKESKEIVEKYWGTTDLVSK